MFEDFIKEYIQDIIECSDTTYDITEEQLQNLVYTIANDDGIWQVIDETIYEKLDKYEKEED